VLTVSGKLDNQKRERFWRGRPRSPRKVSMPKPTVPFTGTLGKKHLLLRLAHVRLETNRIVPAEMRRDSARKGHVLL